MLPAEVPHWRSGGKRLHKQLQELIKPPKGWFKSSGDLSTSDVPEHLASIRRVDYILQETPLEGINEYLGAINSHTQYWCVTPASPTPLLTVLHYRDNRDVASFIADELFDLKQH